MDLGYLKIKIDIKAEYEEYRKKYEFRRKEMKREEIKRVFDGFKDYFKKDGHFKFKETDHSIVAEYKSYGITLDMDVYKNADSPGFGLEGIIKTFDKEVFDFYVDAVPSSPVHEQPFIDEQDKLLNQTRYYKEFLNNDIIYSFRYRINGRGETYATIQELLLGL